MSTVTYASAKDLEEALRRAEAAHAEHERRAGPDPDWPAWYAEYMVRERSGDDLPK